METRSNYVMVGAVTAALLAGVLLFIVWLAGLSNKTTKCYDIYFSQTVGGLAKGSNVTFSGVPVGQISASLQHLLDVTKDSLELAIDKVREGNRLFDICSTVQKYVETNGYSIVREFVGHGIGTALHEEPQVPNYVDKNNENPRLKEGMVLAIEPMVNLGKPASKVLSDKWTAVSQDGSASAHFEHCVAVTKNGPWVLTRP